MLGRRKAPSPGASVAPLAVGGVPGVCATGNLAAGREAAESFYHFRVFFFYFFNVFCREFPPQRPPSAPPRRVAFAGITPLCYSLFALYDPQSGTWLPPNHVFKIGKDTDLRLLFRMR